MQIRKGTEKDIDEVTALYDALNDYLEIHMNYPGWRKGIYPTREDAVQGIVENNLFVAVVEDNIAGTFILRHRPEDAYALADWGSLLDVYENNMPAIRLYEQMGFRYVDTVDLGYGMYGLDRFRLYQRIL